MIPLRLTFMDIVEESISRSNELSITPMAIIAKPVLLYSTAQLTDDEALVDELTVGLRAAGFSVLVKDSINSIVSDILSTKPVGVLIRVDGFDEIALLSSFINNPNWSGIRVPVIISSARGGSPIFSSAWQTVFRTIVLHDPPNVIQLIAIFNKDGGSLAIVPFAIALESNLKRVRLATDDFTKFLVTASSPVTYLVQLSVQGIPVLSTSVPIPDSGVPPFEGVLKTKIGVSTVQGEHVLSLVGVGGGLTKSALITYKTD